MCCAHFALPQVMAAVETKVPGYFTDKMDEDGEDEDDFGTKTLVLKPDELSYALGAPSHSPCPPSLSAHKSLECRLFGIVLALRTVRSRTLAPHRPHLPRPPPVQARRA